MKPLFIIPAFICLTIAGFADINVNAPADGSTVSSPVHVVAQDPNSIAMHIYIDNNDAYQIEANALDTYVPVGPGTHYVMVQSLGRLRQCLQDAANGQRCRQCYSSRCNCKHATNDRANPGNGWMGFLLGLRWPRW